MIMEGVALAGGLLLPWLLGIGVVMLMIRAFGRPGGANGQDAAPETGEGELAWIAGAGCFVGLFLLTLWMRVLSLAGIRFSVIAIAVPVAVVALVVMGIAFR